MSWLDESMVPGDSLPPAVLPAALVLAQGCGFPAPSPQPCGPGRCRFPAPYLQGKFDASKAKTVANHGFGFVSAGQAQPHPYAKGLAFSDSAEEHAAGNRAGKTKMSVLLAASYWPNSSVICWSAGTRALSEKRVSMFYGFTRTITGTHKVRMDQDEGTEHFQV